MSKPLGPPQLQLMELVWKLAPTTVPELHEVLARSPKIAYTTVLTTMRPLQRRRMVRHEESGKAYVYEPLISRDECAACSVNRLVEDLFEDDQDKLLCHLLGAEQITQINLMELCHKLQRRRG